MAFAPTGEVTADVLFVNEGDTATPVLIDRWAGAVRHIERSRAR
jgi:hypothetical protein